MAPRPTASARFPVDLAPTLVNESVTSSNGVFFFFFFWPAAYRYRAGHEPRNRRRPHERDRVVTATRHVTHDADARGHHSRPADRQAGGVPSEVLSTARSQSVAHVGHRIERCRRGTRGEPRCWARSN